MIFTETSIKDLWVIELDYRRDERGFFVRTYCSEEFAEHGLRTDWPQCNLTRTERVGSIRGMHWQAAPQAEIKLIRCTAGAIWDCIVDVRPDSPTYGRWEVFELSPECGRQLYVGEGLAHGFQVLKAGSEVYYHMSAPYAPDFSRGFRWDDPEVGIDWPMEPTVISERDRALPGFRAASDSS